MSETLAKSEYSKAVSAANAINGFLNELIESNREGETVADRFYISVIGYGAEKDKANYQWTEKFVKLSWLDENPLKVERVKKNVPGAEGSTEIEVMLAKWFMPIHSANTPICKALNLAYEAASEWIRDHPDSFPPIVVNITDCEPNGFDGDPVQPAKMLMSLSSNCGGVLIWNCHITTQTDAKPILFPSSDSFGEYGLDATTSKLATTVFQMSSVIPDTLKQYALKNTPSLPLTSGSRAMVLNADLVAMLQLLDIGTRVPLQ